MQRNIDHKSIVPPALPPAVDLSNKAAEPATAMPIPVPAAENNLPTAVNANVPTATAIPAAPPVVPISPAHGAAAWSGKHGAVFGSQSPTQPGETSDIVVRVADPVDEDDEPIFDQKTVFTAVPSWLTSMTVHLLLVLVTALFVLPSDPPPRPFELILGEASAPLDDEDELASVEFDAFDTEPVEELSDFDEEIEPIEEAIEEFDPTDDLADAISENAALLEVDLPTLTTVVDVAEETGSDGNPSGGATAASLIPGGLGLRSTQTRLSQAIGAGATEESEEAVARALRWLAKMQRNDGGWDLRDRKRGFQIGRSSNGTKNGATGLALLPFLGAGHTHKDGQYRYVVERGLKFLLRQMKVSGQGNTGLGSLADSQGNNYSHGLCTIAMCEAYAMSGDRNLRMPAQQLINEIVDAQNSHDGGWRYRRGQSGDTSVLGWQLMALKSGKMAYLLVPDKSFKGASRFLNSVQRDYGSNYGYTSPGASESTTAVGLLSRMYLGWRRERPAMTRGVEALSEYGPSKDEIYFSYYGTQVLHHYGGPMWDKWNVEMRDSLVNSQKRGGENDGSWKLRASHEQGRLYCTSMATMILEVYYRHMPIYKNKATTGVPVE